MKKEHEDPDKTIHSSSSQQIEWPIFPSKKNSITQSINEKQLKDQSKRMEKEGNRFYPLFEEQDEKSESETIQPFLNQDEPPGIKIDPFPADDVDRPNAPNRTE
ncbi:hypothetical protein [Sporolactobacillus nakayamae]|uniref:Uncharacterized protein n=1 Tax=Sporolactobacillus nakayamae TaxID=269670 RepID=A0A1I2RC66_9BACL|nr:hypothetical protein [Sporolactobacillus nakayamae]SFG37079.1 hypothetical protein SAMN02982927_01493 [Sporolactobacillus nakayamae]